MLENISQFAEAVASDVSRRAFFGRFSHGAVACAAAVAGLLALPAVAHAGGKVKCCAGRCQRPAPKCTLINNCHNCNPFTFCRDCEWDCNGTFVFTSCG
jgi:hypothetical protein